MKRSAPSSVDVPLLRLRQRIERHYATTTQKLWFGDVQVSFTRVTDPDVVLDQVVAECDRLEKTTGRRVSDPEHLPYWAELWDSAGAMATFITSPRLAAMKIRPIRGAQIMDLGCGLGLSGSVAAGMGASVTFADLEPPALLFARLNSWNWRQQCIYRKTNWQRDDLQQRFEIILGADILYERKQWEYLDAFWTRHLADGGAILLGEPGRPTGDDFPGWITGTKWRLETHEQIVPTRPKPVRIFHLRRR